MRSPETLPSLAYLIPESKLVALPLGAHLALSAYSATQADPAGLGESFFLNLLITGMVAVIAFLGIKGARPTLDIAIGTALLATATVWIAYQGPSRGAAVSAILLIGMIAGAARALLDDSGRVSHLSLGVSTALAIGLQLALRCDLLLAPLSEPRTLVSLLVLPAVAGAALWCLGERFGAERALIAGGAAVVLAPGWTVTSTLAVLALAAGGIASSSRQPMSARVAAGIVLLMLPLWNLSTGALFLVGALAATRSLTLPFATVLAALTVLSPQANAPLGAALLSLGALAFVPAALLAAQEDRGRALLGLVLTLAAAMTSPVPEAMALGVVTVALALPLAGAVASLQRFWSTLLVLGAALLSIYPWVRDEPLADFFELLGLDNVAAVAGAALIGVVALGKLIDVLRRRASRWAPHPLPLACLLVAGALASLAGPATVLVDSYNPVQLAETAAAWQKPFDPQTVKRVVIDSNLAGGAELRPGTVVASADLLSTDGEFIGRWNLLAGYNTAEWASTRPDLEGRFGAVTPSAWIATVAPDGSFFARRFRARAPVPQQMRSELSSQLVIRRAEHLPPSTLVSIYRIELRR